MNLLSQVRGHFRNALCATAAIALLPVGQCFAQATEITAADTANIVAPNTYTEGSITLAPFATGGAAGNFNTSEDYLGVAGGSNGNAVDNADGVAGGADEERLEMTFASGFGLSEIRFGFTRARPIVLSGFTGNPLVSVIQDPSGGNTTTALWNGDDQQLEIFQTVFSGSETVFSFGDTDVSAGQTITLTVEDELQAGPQAAITLIASADAVAAEPGDVDGDGDVDEVDFAFIRDNFFSTGVTRREGDLVPNGNLSVVDFADYQQWADNFVGDTSGFLAQLTATVPEPSCLLLLASSLMYACGIRRRTTV